MTEVNSRKLKSIFTFVSLWMFLMRLIHLVLLMYGFKWLIIMTIRQCYLLFINVFHIKCVVFLVNGCVLWLRVSQIFDGF